MSPFIPLAPKIIDPRNPLGMKLDFNDWNQIKDNINSGLFRPIANSSVASSVASVSFTSLPQTFTNLFFLAYARSDNAVAQNVGIRLNNDATAIYDENYFFNSNATTVSSGIINSGALWSQVCVAVASGGPTGSFGISWGFISYYSSTLYLKNGLYWRSYYNSVTAPVSSVQSFGVQYRSTSAISRIDFIAGAGNIVAGSRFGIYGF